MLFPAGGIPISPELMKYTPISYDWKKSQRKSMGFSVYSGEWNNSGRKRGGQSSPSSLSDIESFWKGYGRGESLISITQFLKKLHMKLVGDATKMLCIGYD